MVNLREFMLKKGNTNVHELATKRSSPPAGAKGNAHELAINFHELLPFTRISPPTSLTKPRHEDGWL